MRWQRAQRVAVVLATLALAATSVTSCSTPSPSSTASAAGGQSPSAGGGSVNQDGASAGEPMSDSVPVPSPNPSPEPGPANPSASDTWKESQASQTPEDQVAGLRKLPFDSSTIDVAAAIMAGSGVHVIDGDAHGSQLLASPVVISDWQLRNMAAQAANGGGVPAAVLTDLAPTADDQPPVAYLVAAWAMVYDSPGARFSRELLRDQDMSQPAGMVFPDMVLALFLADATNPDPATGSGLRLDPGALRIAAGPCTAVTSFVHQAIGSVATALKVNSSGGGFLGFLGKIWNKAVELAAGAVEGLIKAVTQPVVDVMVSVFATIATVAQVSSFVTQWRATLAPDPQTAAFGVDGAVVTGQVRITVQHDEIPIPEIISDCADSVGVDLRHAGSAAGSKLDWDPINSGRDDLTTTSQADEALDDAQQAVYAYQTGQEDSETATKGEEHSGLLRLRASVHRSDIAQLQRLVESVLLSQIPDVIRPFVAPVAQQLLGSALDHLSALADVTATSYVAVSYHLMPEKTTPPVAAAAPSSPSTPKTRPGESGRPRCPSEAEVAAVIGDAIVDSQQVPVSLITGNDAERDTICSYATAAQGGADVRIGPDGLKDLAEGEPPAHSTPVSVPGPLWSVILPGGCTADQCGVLLGWSDVAAGIGIYGASDRDRALKAAIALAVLVASG